MIFICEHCDGSGCDRCNEERASEPSLLSRFWSSLSGNNRATSSEQEDTDQSATESDSGLSVSAQQAPVAVLFLLLVGACGVLFFFGEVLRDAEQFLYAIMAIVFVAMPAVALILSSVDVSVGPICTSSQATRECLNNKPLQLFLCKFYAIVSVVLGWGFAVSTHSLLPSGQWRMTALCILLAYIATAVYDKTMGKKSPDFMPQLQLGLFLALVVLLIVGAAGALD